MFRMLDFYAAMLMCIGLTMFTLADSKVNKSTFLICTYMIEKKNKYR